MSTWEGSTRGKLAWRCWSGAPRQHAATWRRAAARWGWGPKGRFTRGPWLSGLPPQFTALLPLPVAAPRRRSTWRPTLPRHLPSPHLATTPTAQNRPQNLLPTRTAQNRPPSLLPTPTAQNRPPNLLPTHTAQNRPPNLLPTRTAQNRHPLNPPLHRTAQNRHLPLLTQNRLPRSHPPLTLPLPP